MKRFLLSLIAALPAVLSFAAFDACERQDVKDRYPSDVALVDGRGPLPEPGRWCTDFPAAKAMADAQGVPLLLVYGVAGCPCCNLLTDTALNGSEFRAWAASRRIMMAYVKDGESASALDFLLGASTAAYIDTPAIVVYWPKKGSKAATVEFAGRDGRMPVKTGTLARQLIDSVEKTIGAYVTPHGCRFAVGNTVGDRLEAEQTTTFVDVPIAREWSAEPGPYRLTAVFPDGSASTFPVAFDAEGAASVRIDIPVGAFALGKSVALSLVDDAGGTWGTSAITFVKRENSPKNPTWRGVSSYGEWTMDLAAAKAFAAAHDGSYLLALVEGSMWCPDCSRTGRHLLDSAAFRAWADEKRVVCVAVDIPNWSAEVRSGPCLLTREAGTVSDAYAAADPDGGRVQSGAGYLSRWMISDADAAAQLEANRKLAATDTLSGGWNRPERENQYRTGVPILLLLNVDGSIAGRIENFAYVSPSGFEATYIDRLNDLLATAGGTEADMHWSTTGDDIAADGASASGTLSAVDGSDVWRVTGVGDGGCIAAFTVRGGTAEGVGNDVALSLWKRSASGMRKVSEQFGNLAAGVTLSGLDLPGSAEAYVQLSVMEGGTTFAFGRKGPSEVLYSISSRASARPADKPEEVDPGEAIALVKGVLANVMIDLGLPPGQTARPKKVSGKLPTGVKVAVSDGALVVSGTPKANAGDYKVVYSVGEKTVELAFHVDELAAMTRRTLSDVMVVDAASRRLEGLLTVNLPASGNITAKYRCAAGNVSLKSKGWTRYDHATGTLFSVLDAGKKDYSLELALHGDGSVEAVLRDPTHAGGLEASADAGGFGEGAADWAGLYTVDFCKPTATSGTLSAEGDVTMALKVTAAAGGAKAKCSGVLPDGQAFSATAALVREDVDTAVVPILCASKKARFAGAVRIVRRRPARAVGAVKGIACFWTGAAGAFEARFGSVAGSAYVPGTDLAADALSDSGTVDFAFTTDGASTGVPVTVTAAKPVIAAGAENPQALRLGFAKGSGYVSGSFKTVDAAGKAVSAKFKGVVLPGWGGCPDCNGRPWAAGAYWFADRSVPGGKAGGPFEIVK